MWWQFWMLPQSRVIPVPCNILLLILTFLTPAGKNKPLSLWSSFRAGNKLWVGFLLIYFSLLKNQSCGCKRALGWRCKKASNAEISSGFRLHPALQLLFTCRALARRKHGCCRLRWLWCRARVQPSSQTDRELHISTVQSKHSSSRGRKNNKPKTEHLRGNRSSSFGF